MTCCVCILHSTGVLCGSELVSQAAYCVSSMFYSLFTCSADFIPSVAVLCANPVEGVRYAYTSSAEDASYGDGVEEIEKERGSAVQHIMNGTSHNHGVAACIRGRSAFCLQRAILCCGGSEDDVKKEENGEDKIRDVWRCLAGALLTACFFLRSHVAGYENCASALPLCAAQSGRGFLVVFSDVCDTEPLSFSAECSFSAAAMALTKLEATVNVFGQAALHGVAAGRLRALVHATGGVCAARYALSHVGRMLDKIENSQQSQDAKLADRRSRERLVEQYVVRPVNLPQEPELAFAANAANASHLAWLCPSCMTVMVRHLQEDRAARSCPYCLDADTA